MLINSQIPALYNGISQQPAPLRLPSQGEVQINGWSTVVDGQRKRPPTQHVAQLAASDLSSEFMHIINRDTTERYFVVISNGNLQVFDFAGNAKTVAFPNGKAYLTAASPLTEFSAVSVADYTFIVNKTVTVQMLAVAADQLPQSPYSFWLNKPIPGSAIVPGGYNARMAQYGTNPVVTALSLKGSVQTFADLPKPTDPTPPAQGDVYEIQGDATSAFTSYYVIYQSGVWNETVKPGIQNAIDPTTMPWALVRGADGNFTFSTFSWKPRVVGDENTNANPSFVGRTLRDIFFTKNRLAFTCDENVIFSASGDYGNFYRLTVTQLLADSVVDIGASQTSVTILNFAVPFQQGIMLFADQGQYRFIFPTNGDITPTTVGIEQATSYLSSTTVRPLQLGSDIYFISEDDAYAHLRQYYVKMVGYLETATTADDVSSHVPMYVPKGVYLLAGSLIHDALFMSTSASPNRLYVYKFEWANDKELAQSAWSYWDFGVGTKVLAATGLDDYLYVLLVRNGATFIEKVSLAQGENVGLVSDTGYAYDILLDRRVPLTGVYLPAPQNYTTFTVPYAYNSPLIQLVMGAGQATPGALIDPSTYTFPTTTTVQVPGNKAGAVFAGEAYTHTFQFSEQFTKNQNNVAVLSGRLTMRNYTVYYSNAAYFSTSVDSYGSGNPSVLNYIPSQTAAYEGLTLGEVSLTLGAPSFRSGKFTFGIFGASDECIVTLTNNSPYQATFESAEWEGDYINRSRTA